MTDASKADLVLVEDIDRVRLVTLNRPEKANAFNDRLYHSAAGALIDAEADSTVSVVVFTGAGRVFSGGVDITEMTAVIPEDGQPISAPPPAATDTGGMSRGFDAFVNALQSFPKPLMAAVNGSAVGIGFTMLLHCDVVLMSENARLRPPFTRMGVAPEAGSSFLLPRRMGRQRAALALFTSDWIQPEEAVEHGLAVQVCPADRLIADTVELASRIAEHSLPSLMATKRLIIEADHENIVRARELEGQAFAELLRLPNARDRVVAQLDKSGLMAAPIPEHPLTFWGVVEQRAALTPDVVMLADDAGHSVTFGEYRQRAEEVAAALSARGITSGSVVSWQIPTTIDAVVLMAALTRLDAVQNPIIPIMREREVTYITREAKTDLVIAPATFRGFNHHAMLETITVSQGFEILDCDDGLPSADPSTLPPVPSFRDASELPARWLYHTSGSTGDPKGVWHTDASVMAGSYGFIAGYTPTPDDVYPMAFPITHIGGVAIVTSSLLTGYRLVLLDVFDVERSPLVMAEHGATLLGSAIPFFQAYMAAQRKHGPEPLFPRLRSCVGGGAPNSPELHREVQEVLGGRGVCSSWGLTEFPIATAPSIDDTDEQLSTTEGRLSPGVDIRIIRPDGSECAPGEAGELCLFGPQLLRAYANPELMKDAFDDHGFFRTGDLGLMLPSGHVRITGRLKDVVIRNAENISATEVEDVLHGHAKIADVAIIGVPDPRTGERCSAVVQLADGVDSLTLTDIGEHCRSVGLATQKIPEQLEIVDEIPRNPMGKIRKQELRDRYAR